MVSEPFLRVSQPTATAFIYTGFSNDGMNRRAGTEVLQAERLPPGYFENVVCRRKNWLGVFNYDLSGPRWNTLIPVPGSDGEVPGPIPQEMLELASQIGNNPCIFGEASVVEDIRQKFSNEEFEAGFEMTYLVPESVEQSDKDLDIEYRKTTDNEVREDFLQIFRIAFGEEENGTYVVSEEMDKGIKRVIEMKGLGTSRLSFVGYTGGEPVSTGSISIFNGMCSLYNVATHINHRNKGYGSAMTGHLIDTAKALGADEEEIYIGTQPGTDVEKFYKKIGCKEAFRTKALEADFLGLDESSELVDN